MTAQPAIRITNLSKTFGRRRKRIEAVKHVTLDIPVGQVYGFLGPNGAGKTTTIRMMLDLIRPTEGDVTIFGQHVRREHGVLRRVGAIVEGAMFYNFLSGRRNLEVLARTANDLNPKRIDALLEQVGLAHRADQRVKGYSTGMKQRLGLAAALLGDPDLLILDEPTNGLDPAGIEEIRTLLVRLAGQGITVMVSSHLLDEIDKMASVLGILSGGRMIFQGTRDELFAHSIPDLIIETPDPRKALELVPNATPARSDGPGSGIKISGTDKDQTAAIVHRLAVADVPIYEVRRVQQSLEDVFMDLTGRGGLL